MCIRDRITDYHRGSTRSIATGLHMSGIYVGMAVAGFGATMASWTGWRMTLALFGLLGVAYALVLILFLKDPAKAPADTAQEMCIRDRRLGGRFRLSRSGPVKSFSGEKPCQSLICHVSYLTRL